MSEMTSVEEFAALVNSMGVIPTNRFGSTYTHSVEVTSPDGFMLTSQSRHQISDTGVWQTSKSATPIEARNIRSVEVRNFGKIDSESPHCYTVKIFFKEPVLIKGDCPRSDLTALRAIAPKANFQIMGDRIVYTETIPAQTMSVHTQDLADKIISSIEKIINSAR